MKLSDKELEELLERSKDADASLACEGIFLTEEEKKLFREMDEQRLSHEERHKVLNDYLDRTTGENSDHSV